jgi:hypothetical protein
VTLTRYHRRFGGEGTIVTLDDGRAFTAAHCLAAYDGRPGTVVTSLDGRQWRVLRRWSPRGRDLAMLQAIDAASASAGGRRSRPTGLREGRPTALAALHALRPGVGVVFYGYTGRSFRPRRAVLTTVTATRVVADVASRAGVRAGDSGGPVLVGDRVVGVVVARIGTALWPGVSTQLVFERLDTATAVKRSGGPAG